MEILRLDVKSVIMCSIYCFLLGIISESCSGLDRASGQLVYAILEGSAMKLYERHNNFKNSEFSFIRHFK